MREILFRGKRTDDGEWIQGMPCATEKSGIYAIQTLQGGIFDIIPETVGQYTGMTDKNGKKIFEGDILDTPDRLVVVTWLAGNAQFDCEFIKYAHDIMITNFKGICPRYFCMYEVIGNIHDNPELI